MAFDAHKNFAYSTVATAPSPANSGTTLTVQPGDGAAFPAAPFNCTVWPTGSQPLASTAEIIRVTSKGAGDDWTIVRQAEPEGIARPILVGDQIAATITNTTLTDIETAVSNELSVRAAKDDALSNAISVVSQAVSTEASTRAAKDDSLSNQISVVSQGLSAETSARTAKDDLLSNAISIVSQAISVVSVTAALALSVGNAASNAASIVSVGVDRVSQAVSVETANRISADNVLSNAISTVSQQLSLQVSALSQALSAFKSGFTGGTTGQVLKKISNTNFDYGWSSDNTGGSGSATVTSQTLSAHSQAISVLSQQVSVISQQVSALSQAVSTLSVGVDRVSNAASNALSVGNAASNAASIVSVGVDRVSNAASNALSVANAASNAASIVSQALSVETANRVAAVNVVSQAVSVLSQQLSVLSQQVSVLSAVGHVLNLQNNDTSAVSAGAPIYLFTSAATFKRANASAAATKHAIGLVIDGSIAVSTSGRVQTGGPVTLTTGQWDNITGQTGGLTIGSVYYLDVTAGLLTTTAPSSGVVRPVGIAVSTTVLQLTLPDIDDPTSAIDRVSNAASIVSVGVDRVSNAASNALSVGNAASNAASVVSQALSVETANRISADNSLSNAISALSAQLSLQISAISQVHSALSQAVSILSVQVASAISIANAASNAASIVSVGVDRVSNAASNALSVANAASNAVSIHSAAYSLQVSAFSQQISVLSVQVASAISIANAASNAASIVSVGVDRVSNAASNALSVANAASNAASIVSQALSVETADRKSAVDVVSQQISVISQQLSIISANLSVLSQNQSVLSQRMSTMAGGTTGQVLKKNSNSDYDWGWAADNTGVGGSGTASATVTSQHLSTMSVAIDTVSNAVSIVSQALSVETADRMSADNVLSNSISVLSSWLVIGLQNTGAATITRGSPVYLGTSANTMLKASAGRSAYVGIAVDDTAVSAIGRVQVNGVVSLPAGQWDGLTGGSGGLTPGTTYFLDGSPGFLRATAPAIGGGLAQRPVGYGLDATHMLLRNDLGLNAADALSAINAQAFGTLSQAISVVSVQAASAISIANAASNAASIVSQALSVETANRISADNVLSQQISVLSQQLSVLSAGIGAPQMKVLQGAQTVSVSTVTNVSGLSISVAAGGTYNVIGQMLFNVSSITAMGFGLSYPQMAALAGAWECAVSVNPGVASVGFGVSGLVRVFVQEAAAANGSNSAVLSITPQASAAFTYRATFDYVMNVSAGGTVAVVAKQSGSSPGFVILKGSFIQAFKLV